MERKHQKQTQSKHAHQTIETATDAPTIKSRANSFYIGVLIFICFLGKFADVIYGISNEEGVFGYLYMSSFLYALGNEISTLALGLILLYAANRVYPKYKKNLRKVSHIVVAIGAFELIAIFVPKVQMIKFCLLYLPEFLGGNIEVRDFPPIIYYTIMIALSIASGHLLIKFHNMIIETEHKLRNALEGLLKFCLRWRREIPFDKRMDYSEDFFKTAEKGNITK
ncbi:hypothetical protein [uncultured Winogradskyella sp.]|uniref:hypothetical protein n=1 Tax=uncultured Winogradskyella sp. TaxID=395353 RepID=UPI00262C6240|nr:hypothetical protein [uncultured Winogradskyella sp.]